MIKTLRPYGAFSGIIRYRFEQDNKYYIVDITYSQIEIEKDDYMKLKAPIKKVVRKVSRNNEVQ